LIIHKLLKFVLHFLSGYFLVPKNLIVLIGSHLPLIRFWGWASLVILKHDVFFFNCLGLPRTHGFKGTLRLPDTANILFLISHFVVVIFTSQLMTLESTSM